MHTDFRSTCRRQGLERLLSADHGEDHPPHLPRRRRLDAVVAAPGHHRGREPVTRQFHRAQFRRQPRRQPVLVLLGIRPKPVRRPDLTPVPLDRLALQVVVRPRSGRNLHLLGHVLHRGGRHLLDRLREPGLHLEELQQQSEPEPGRPGLVPHPLHVVFEQRPDLDQVLRLPVLPHPRSSTPARDHSFSSTRRPARGNDDHNSHAALHICSP
jgi:hypothetical protein